ncbi:glutamine-hydrolyzing carbamoyl-phosphate synthase small subunit [Blochmannia endosymbiont of Camponotus (Colobopsis) obliquus]|uniref:glutamine-hydrolyzing carbamoyl-phosphate synthase small subunit n=1 Tax=Blochmannia endosymbiont of Camponotus (Colobopsis) obliquus TaxID=1505597 RepID=UPI00061A55E7|nr:glutamine-hydrolyzing carbamoyl-phosphate synthase small subunit [Blochmannia endosymbiont of Camponotus (Colobopsis) obliquus]AKC60299.1 carbamoyl-phosphate synthase small chain [Blochmannia endosymbiont of Camponotus (Colobopsis) obliquus]
MIKSALLVLEDGTTFYGRSIGVNGTSVGEVVFNTSITGYQEILTDPSYSQQIVVLTYPHIGNVGINEVDSESSCIQVQGLVVRDLSLITSNFRHTLSLSDYLIQQHIVAIADIDTRKLTRLLRSKGIQNGCIIADDNQPSALLALNKVRAFSGLCGIDLVKQVSTTKQYIWNEGSWSIKHGLTKSLCRDYVYNVIAYDFGIKRNIMRMLVDRGCRVTVVPAQTSAEQVLKMLPDGIFLANGPGDPSPCNYAINSIKVFLKFGIPLFGICLGYQLLALANGARIMKMKFGHHGSNHPVKDLITDKVMITTQNHCFAVDSNTLPATLQATHISLFDGTLQGIRCVDKPAFGFQGHPEACPGPHDSSSLFDYFVELISVYHSHRINS